MATNLASTPRYSTRAGGRGGGKRAQVQHDASQSVAFLNVFREKYHTHTHTRYRGELNKRSVGCSDTHTHALHLQSSSSSFKRLVLLLLRRRRRLDDCYDGEGGARVRNGRRARS